VTVDSITRTLTAPDGERGDEPVPAVALRERSRGVVVEVPEGREISIGTNAACELPVENAYVSRVHCLVSRDGPLLRVRDQRSHNGTFVTGDRVDEAYVGPGTRIVLAGAKGVSLVALSPVMVTAEPVARLVVGYDAHEVIDDLLADGERDVAIIGEPGCDQDRLVQVIHRVSPRGRMPLIRYDDLLLPPGSERRLVEELGRATLVLSADKTGRPLVPLVRALLFARECEVRKVVLAQTTATAMEVVGVETFARMQVVEVPPVRRRKSDLRALVDHELAQRGSDLRFAGLSAANQTALSRYEWPGNLPRLREVVDWLHAIGSTGSIRRAADRLAVSRSSLQDWLDQIGLGLPLRRRSSAKKSS
jgi:hypothetical protein